MSHTAIHEIRLGCAWHVADVLTCFREEQGDQSCITARLCTDRQLDMDDVYQHKRRFGCGIAVAP